MRFVEGDLLEADVEAWVNPVNCVGVMGRGLAAQFKRAYPDMFEAYRAATKAGEVAPGVLHVHELSGGRGFVVNLPTKRHWRAKARLEDVDAGLIALASWAREQGVASLAIPRLGCGLGGLDWEVVRPRVQDALGPLEGVDVRIYGPAPSPVQT